jgi:hypothetical protein
LVSPFAHIVADRSQFGAGDVAASEQIRVAFRDAPAS